MNECARPLALLLATATGLWAAEPIGRAISVTGQPTAVGADGATRVLSLKSPVFLNDRIATPRDSSLQILFTDDSTLSQGPDGEMVVDRYTYAPARKSENACSIGLKRGTFRFLTEKITALNPEGTQVRTPMATMAVRGCDLGFWVRLGEEHFAIFSLHGLREVTVSPNVGGAGTKPGSGRRAHVFREAGVMASVRADGAVRRGSIPQGVSAGSMAAPVGTAAGGGGPGGPAGAGSGPGEPSPGVAGSGLALAAAGVGQGTDSGIGAGLPAQAPPPPPVTVVAALVGAAQALSPAPLPPAPPLAPSSVSTLSVAVEVPPVDLTPVFERLSGGTDWSWGAWKEGGEITAFEVSSDLKLTGPAFAALASGPQIYNLTGIGVSGAVIEGDGRRVAVAGVCSLDVQVGGSVAPNWGGRFTAGLPGMDSLDFGASGTIDKDGRLTGASTTYSMQARGVAFDKSSITAEEISGNLVGSGAGAAPATGAIGAFSFDHGAQTRVRGGFATNLR